MNRSTPIAFSKWMWCLCSCQVRAQVEVENVILDVNAWTEKTRSVGFRCNKDKPKTYIVKRGWRRVPVAWKSIANFNKRWALNTNSW